MRIEAEALRRTVERIFAATGRATVVFESGTVAVIDGNMGFGQVTGGDGDRGVAEG